MKRSKKKLLWVFGPAAAGKTTFLKHIKQKFLSQNDHNIEFLSDLEELTNLIKKDHHELFHTKLQDNQFAITNSVLYDWAFIELCNKLWNHIKQHKKAVVEVACGTGIEDTDSLSLAKRLMIMPDKLISMSTFLFVKNSLHRRMKFNSNRKSVAKTPDIVFQSFFLHDDYKIATQRFPYQFEIIDNCSSKQTFLSNIDKHIERLPLFIT